MKNVAEKPVWLVQLVAGLFVLAAGLGFGLGDFAVQVVAVTLLLGATGLCNELVVRQVRHRPSTWVRPFRAMVYPRLPAHPMIARALTHARELRRRFDAIDWIADWLPGFLALIGSALALWLTTGLVHKLVGDDGSASVPTAAVLLGATIPLLIVQRLFVADEARGPSLDATARLALLASLVMGAASLFGALGYTWTQWFALPVLIVAGVVAVEVMARTCAAWFSPPVAFTQRRASALTWTASLLRLQRPRLDRASAWLTSAYGIDLSRSWVAAFAVRATLPVVGALGIVAWLASGVSIVRVDERAIVEHLGAPGEVVGPGMHVHAPWPLATIRRVELGVVHELPIVFSQSADGQLLAELATAGQADAAGATSAEAIPDPPADRLWDGSHPGEASYLIASSSGGREGFQIVNVDLRVVYRVDSTDQAALASAYGAFEPASLIRASAGRLLVSHFAISTLDGILGESRSAFVDRFRRDLQHDMDAYHAGIAVLAVVVEAIHPPAGAARAYHNVQATEIQADTMRFQSRAHAVAVNSAATEEAIQNVNQSRATAAEALAAANATRITFGAEARSQVAGPNVFLFESWLSHLRDDLSKARVTIVDHRLEGATSTLDLRAVAPGSSGGYP
ncbi:SPFH domain-containing protein [Pinirhizobacter sp.]|jgi:regulator of protease activity HflC (stomatin/prohibitin superfamily)|uniref:SPFH domain-containing protein n=1 Tax=Pinirhizobacter sp. TaxID=2950432 RepID=UPI002F3E3963